MSTSRRANRLRSTVNMTSANPVDPLQEIRDKFTRLTDMRARIEQAKLLYKAYDELLEELLPCFVTKTDTGFNIKNQITVGDKTYRLHPAFFDVAKNKVVAKQFKAAFHPTMVIEG